MRFLSGSRTAAHADLYADGTLGLLRTPANRYRLDGVAVWALDNGCFTNGYPGDAAYLALLRKLAPHAPRCLFAAAPDVVGSAQPTLARSQPMFARIRALGYPVALVGQDGMEALDLPWGEFDWLFVGGSTRWKLGEGAHQLCAQAHAHGVPVHVGRVNSQRRYLYAAHHLGAVSCDGTFLAFGPTSGLPEVLGWLRASRQGVLGS